MKRSPASHQVEESQDHEGPRSLGGSWTEEKLGFLSGYLDSYTTSLKGEPVRLLYIDAFAGSGGMDPGCGHEHPDWADYSEFVTRSARIAIETMNRSFDELVFIETDEERILNLEDLQLSHAYRSIHVFRGDAGRVLRNLQRDWRSTRGVLFLDPFGLSVNWPTVERIASLDALDTWFLFPMGSLSRVFPRGQLPQEIRPALSDLLTAVYGDSRWKEMYSVPFQANLFGNPEFERAPGVEGLLEIYKGRLSGLFGSRYSGQTVRLRNAWGVALYEFIFCAGSAAGAASAKEAAAHMMDMNSR